MKQPNLAVNNSLDIRKVYMDLLRLAIKLRNNDTQSYDFDLSYCYRIDKYGVV